METLSDWVNQYAEGMLSWTSFKVSDMELAKDLVQDTFLIASEKFATFRGESSPKTWLYSILNHKIIDYYRKKIKQPVSQESSRISNYFTADGEWKSDKRPEAWDEQEGHLLDNDAFNVVLKQCMDALPEQWGIAVKLKFLASKKGEEVCAELGITPSNFWQIVRRAKLQLRECLENNWFQTI